MGYDRDLRVSVIAHLRGRRHEAVVELGFLREIQKDAELMWSTTNVTGSVTGLRPVYGVVMVVFRKRTIWFLLKYVGCAC